MAPLLYLREVWINIDILANERLDDLQYKGLMLIQKKGGFRFGIDAVLLSDFTKVPKNGTVIDLGTGSGIIAILIAAKKEPRKVVGLEIQEDIAEMAGRSVRMNGLGGKIEIVCGDIRDAAAIFGHASFDVAVANPPYMEKGGGILNPSGSRAISRHELLCTLDDLADASAKLLKQGGKLFMVHRPHRLADIMCRLRARGIEPKELRLVHPSPGKRPNLVLVGGIKGASPELKVHEPLYIYDGSGRYSDEIYKIYGIGVNRDGGACPWT